MTMTNTQSMTERPSSNNLNPKSTNDLTLDPPQKGLIAGAGIVGLVLLVYLLATQSVAQPILLIIGLLFGYTLYQF